MAKELTEGQAYKEINELFGGVVSHSLPSSNAEVISTGSPALDRALIAGGWPRGRFIQLAGKEGSGKTFIAMLAMIAWQRLDPENCVSFLDAEHTFNAQWAESLGMDLDRVFYVESNIASDLFRGLIGKVKKNKATGKITKLPGMFDMIRDGQKLKYKNPLTNNVVTLNLAKMGVIVLDSIASIVTPLEMESEPGKQNYAAIARFLSNELKKLTPGIAQSNVIMFGINQVRVDMNIMYGNPDTTPGGKALRHACTLMVQFARMSGADNIIVDEFGDKIGNRIRAKITKNKMGPEGRKAEFFVRYDKGVVRVEEELLDLGALVKYIERPNNRSYIIGGEKFSSRAAAVEHLKGNLDFYIDDIKKHYLSLSSSEEKTPDDDVEEEVVENPFEMGAEE